MIISLIVAASENNVIGIENKLPWHQPEDLKFFKNTTWGMPVAMGRKTFEAVGKPLPGRMNIVITRDKFWHSPGAITVGSIADAVTEATDAGYKEIFITGGGEIFLQSMLLADRIYLTRIHADIKGDAFFPEINEAEWELTGVKDFKADEKNKYDMSFETWQKRDVIPQ